MLETGRGAGRFTEVVLATGATVVSFDYSNAAKDNLVGYGDSGMQLGWR